MSKRDKIVLLLALLLVAAGVFGYYQLSYKLLQILSVAVGLIAAGIAVYFSPIGYRFIVYANASIIEGKKVVWPKLNEGNRMTLLVVAFVVILSLFMWLIDSIFSYLVYYVLLK